MPVRRSLNMYNVLLSVLNISHNSDDTKLLIWCTNSFYSFTTFYSVERTPARSERAFVITAELNSHLFSV